MAICKACEANIIWAETTSGKRMPIDAAPTPKGNLVYVNGVAKAAGVDDRRLQRPLYTSQFATCPDAASFRKTVREVLHYTRGGRFVGRGSVVTIGRNWAACGGQRADAGGALDPAKVTCRRCLCFLRSHTREGDS